MIEVCTATDLASWMTLPPFDEAGFRNERSWYRAAPSLATYFLHTPACGSGFLFDSYSSF